MRERQILAAMLADSSPNRDIEDSFERLSQEYNAQRSKRLAIDRNFIRNHNVQDLFAWPVFGLNALTRTKMPTLEIQNDDEENVDRVKDQYEFLNHFPSNNIETELVEGSGMMDKYQVDASVISNEEADINEDSDLMIIPPLSRIVLLR